MAKLKSILRFRLPGFVGFTGILLAGTLVAAREFLSPGLSPEQVLARMDSDTPLLIVDIRKPAEFRAGHIPGAVNIPLHKLEKRVTELKGGQDVLIYCINGKRTRKAEPMLLELGIENVYHLDGAFFSWQKSGFKTEKGWTR